MRRIWRASVVLVAVATISFVATARAQDATEPAVDPAAEVPTPETAPADPAADPNVKTVEKLSADIPGLTRLDKNGDVWIDPKRKIVVIDGRVALREGQLEMFACPKGTKEHESLVAVTAKPSVIHAGLLTVGAKSGTQVKWDPKYEPATGQVIEVLVLWKDKEGKNRKMRAQEWIRDLKTKKPMDYDWVFAGSGFWVDEDNGTKHYHADAGDFICVSNFSTATLDLPVKSSQDNTNLQFEAFTENMPEKGTKVRLVLIPKEEKKKDAPKSE